MSTTFFIYLLTRLTALNHLSIATTVIFGIMLMFCVVDSFMDEDYRVCSKKFKYTSITGVLISVILLVITPTTGEAFFIWCGGKTIDYAENNEQLKALPDKAIESAYNYLDALNEEIKERRDTTIKK